ncbi:MAG: TraR/DksA family transcriptional regulator [Methylophilus sp.]
MARITQHQINELKNLMEAELAELVDETQEEMNVGLKENYVDIESDVGDKADEAFADTSVDIDNAIIGFHLEKVEDLNAALDRMQKGEYGVCVDCGSDVDFERLSAYPTAKRCISCQKLHEKTFGSENKSSF